VAAASGITAADLLLNGRCSSVLEAVRLSAFQIASISTTTGFATADTDTWPALSITVLCLCSVFCGCTGSTSGGIKVDRALLAAKGMRVKLHSILHPAHVETVRIDGRIRMTEEVEDTFIFILFYLGLIAFGGFVNSAGGMDLRSGVSAAMACMGNVGPGFGNVGSMGNYAGLPDILKVNSMILMLLGRLEIYPFFLVFGRFLH
jgi:trk system potassium uptake protein TrkH